MSKEMMICPKAKECGIKARVSAEWRVKNLEPHCEPHEWKISCDSEDTTHHCPACIPYIPEQPKEPKSMSKKFYVRSRSNDFTLEQPKKPVEPVCPECGHKMHKDRCTELIPLERYNNDRDLYDYRACGCAHTPADLQPEPIDEMSQYLRQTCVYRDTCVSTMKCRNCGVFMAEPVKPEAGRQVSRDFDTIEHEAEMPLREQFHRVLSRMDKPTWGGGISWNEALNWMVLIIEAHDQQVRQAAVKKFAEKVCAWLKDIYTPHQYVFDSTIGIDKNYAYIMQEIEVHIRAMAEGKE